MESNGFEVIAMETGGFPVVSEFIAHNEIQNLICLACSPDRKADILINIEVDLTAIHRQLRNSYKRHSLNAVFRQMQIVMHETARLFYHLVFAAILGAFRHTLLLGFFESLSGDLNVISETRFLSNSALGATW